MAEVLYRKWRPRRLDQVVGQDPITQTLRQAVVQGRVAHAYLFCGPRGTGKTSTARILAKAVNCLSPQNGEPDNQCAMCLSINEGRALDLIEIDAASNRGIDDIRSLSDKIHFTPSEARYKVYIIDEVHMLTEPAFNALLKTLEEPPAHAIFVLATTEAHKVPLTIVSRCQRFDFRRIPLDRMVAKLAEICDSEGIQASAEALTLIARASTGGLRDAENLLEQVLVSYGSPITEESVKDLLGLGGDEMALELVGHVIQKSARDGLRVINEFAGQGSDLRQLHRGVMEYLRETLLLKSGAGTPLGYPDDVVARLKTLAGATSMEHLVHALKTFSSADLRRDSSSPLPLELALVECCTELPAPTAERPAAAPAQPPAREAPASHAGQPRTSNTPPRPAARPAPSQPAQPSASAPPASAPPAATGGVNLQEIQPLEAVPSEPAARLESQWPSIVRALSRYKGKRFNMGALLRGCTAREVTDEAIGLKFSHRSNLERMQQEMDDPETRRAVNEVIARAMGGPYEIRVSMLDGGNGAPKQSAAVKSHLVRAAQSMGARVIEEKEDYAS